MTDNDWLAAVSAALGPDRLSREAAVAARQRQRPQPTVALAACADHESRYQRFVAAATRVRASVTRVPASAASAWILQAAEHGGATSGVSTDRQLRERGWLTTPSNWERPARREDHTGILCATAAVAETGSVLFCSASSRALATMLLPDHLIAVVPAEALVDHAEQALERVPAGEGGRRPRAMTFVTGPSRTADIEEVLLLGAHGPRALSILLVDLS